MITTEQTNSNYKIILKTYLKVRKKKLLFSILVGMIIFLFITTVFMIWLPFKKTSFNRYTVEYNGSWLNDEQIGTYACENIELDNSRNLFTPEYIEDGFNEISNKIYEIAPDILAENFTSLLCVEAFQREEFSTEVNTYSLNALNEQVDPIIENSLIAGRMPNNRSELLYFKKISSFAKYVVNDTVSLRVKPGISPLLQDFRIVGIVENLEENLLQKGYSSDIIYWANYIEEENNFEPNLFFSEELFFTTNDYFSSLLNIYPEFDTGISILYDFNYDIEKIDVGKLAHIINELQLFYQSTLTDFNFEFYINEQAPIFLCRDLLSVTSNFQSYWLQETAKLISFAIPALLALAFLIAELFSVDSTQIKSYVQLLKLNGVTSKNIQKCLFLESLIFSSSSILGGMFFGVIIGYPISILFNIEVSYSYYLGCIFDSLLITILLISWLVILVSSFISSNRAQKEVIILRSKLVQNQRKKIVKKILFIPEIFLFVVGSILLIIGIAGNILVEFVPENNLLNSTYKIYQFSQFNFLLAIYIGCVFLALCVFILLSRLLVYFWSKLGEEIWSSFKNFFTLSMKNLAIDSKNYQRVVITIFILGIGIIPGFTLNNSFEEYYSLEADLATGCSDIIVNNWNFNQSLLNEISTIAEINSIAELKNIKFDYKTSLSLEARNYVTNILAIVNITDFLNVINNDTFEKTGISKDDLLLLNSNRSYLMDEDYARKFEYDKENILYNTNFSKTSEDIALNYVKSFRYFPLLTRPNNIPFQNRLLKFNLVTNLDTSQELVDYAINTRITEKGILLISVIDKDLIKSIKLTLIDDFNIEALSSDDFENNLRRNNDELIMKFIIMFTIVILIIGFIYSFLVAQRIYYQRIKIVESEYKLGATRKQIWEGFTLEIIYLSVIPVIIASLCGILFLNLLGKFLVNTNNSYSDFIPKSPAISCIFLVLSIFLIIIGGWLTSIIISVNKYQPHKQE